MRIKKILVIAVMSVCISNPVNVYAENVYPFNFVDVAAFTNNDSYFTYYPHDNCKRIKIDIGTKIMAFDEEINGYTKVLINNEICWIKSKYISDTINYSDYPIYENGRKSYMDWQFITDISSPHYKLQQQAYTGNLGIRMVGDRYCIAIGSAFTTKIGSKIDLTVQHEDGSTSKIKCILGDCKADCDTDYYNMYGKDGSLAEFIVNTSSLPPAVNSPIYGSGDVSDCSKELSGNIIKIRVYH